MSVSEILVGIPSLLILFAILVFLLVLAVLWFVLPFAVFGIKKRLDEINEHVQSIDRNRALGRLAHDIERHLAAIADSVERIESRIDPDGTQLARYRKGHADQEAAKRSLEAIRATEEESRAQAQARAESIEATIAAEEAKRQERFTTLRAKVSALNKSILSTFGDTYSPKNRAERQEGEAQIRACQEEMRLLEASAQVTCPDCAEVFEVRGIVPETKHTCPGCGRVLEVE